MKPAPFEYHAPATVDDVAGLLAHGDDAKVLAGGQSLVPLLALQLARFGHLVDINGVPDLAGVTGDDGWLRVGAGTRHRVMERDATVADRVPLLARACLPLVGHFQIRNRGTVGGALAHADPAAEYPAVALALDATFEVRGPSGREVAAADFFEGTWTTSMAPDELLVAARFPTWGDRSGFAVEELARRHGDFALVGVVCGVRVDTTGVIDRAAVGFFGVGATPVRGHEAEAALIGATADVDITSVAHLATAGLEPSDDLHATGEYRSELATVLSERAITRALSEATNG